MSEVLIFILIIAQQVIIAFIAAFVAYKRGHSFWIWTAISTCIVPSLLALPLVLIYCHRDNTDRVP